MKLPFLTFFLTAAVSHSFSAHGEKAAWPGFRGANSSGVAARAAKPPVRFGLETNLLWKVEVPSAPSSPCIAQDHIFLTGHANGKLQTLCLRASDGKLLWTRDLAVEKLEEFYPTEGSPAASTPVTDGQRVICYFGSFGVIAYDFSGHELWRHPLPMAQTDGGFGTGTSPALARGLVIINRQQRKDPCLLALDARTGKTVWENRQVDPVTSYGTPIVWEGKGSPQVILPASTTLKAYSLKNGREQWVVKETVNVPCTTPVAGDQLIFYAGWSPGKGGMPSWAMFSGPNDKNHDGKVTADELEDPSNKQFFKAMDQNGDGAVTSEEWKMIEDFMARGRSVVVAVRPGGAGDVTKSHVVWSFDRGLPYVASPLSYQDRVYMIKDGGLLTCLESATGKPVYIQERLPARASYYASPVAADGRIYLVATDGKVTVLKAGAATPEILHETDLGERTAATPAVVGNKLYIRTATKLYAFGEK